MLAMPATLLPTGAQLWLLDRPNISLNTGASYTLTGRAAAVLALASLEPGIGRRRIALMLWPDSPEPQARNNLRTLVHRLNKSLGVELLDAAEHLTVDADKLELHRLSADEIVRALRQGGARCCELLADWALESLDQFQTWLIGARKRVRQQQLADLAQALASALELGETARAIEIARAFVMLDPLSERWHRQLMQTLVDSGDRAAALVAYEECKTTLRQNLGATPDERSRSLHVQILQMEVRAQPAARSRGAADGAALLIERDVPLAQLQTAFEQGAHLVLQGEAGVGKTRLLRQFAQGKVVERVQIRAGARDEPYAALAQLLQEVQQRHALRLGRSERIELARLAPAAFPGIEPSTASLSTSRLHAALHHWAAALFDAGVTLLALDDLHYADADSQALLAGLLDRRAGMPPSLRVLLSHRTGEIGAVLAKAATDAALQQRLVQVTLQRLSLHGIEALLGSIDPGMPAARAEELAAGLLQTTGGNPLFVTELALSTLDRADARGAVVGTNLNALLQSRLSGCSTLAIELASVAGVASADFSVELAAAVSGHSLLELMPAWTELQQRGLFADYGLAHDLVRDAVMAALPRAIKKALHRRVAVFLEGQGAEGAQVLRHWRAADEFDRAFPHALVQWRLACVAGMNDVKAQLDLFESLEKLSDNALLPRLWISAELATDQLPAEMMLRFAALADRVEKIARNDDDRAWVAFRKAELLFLKGELAAAYALATTAAERLPEVGAPTAWCELALAVTAVQLNSNAVLHAQRAWHAGAGLQREHHRLSVELANVRAYLLADSVTVIRERSLQMRQARARADLGAVGAARHSIALAYQQIGLPRLASRHFREPSNDISGPHGSSRDVWGAVIGMAAFNAGRYVEAIAALENSVGVYSTQMRHPMLAYAWLRLGRPDLARPFANAVVPNSLDGVPHAYFINMMVHSELARLDGQDGTAPLVSARDRLREIGAAASNTMLIDWEIESLSATPAQRIALLTQMITVLRGNQWQLPRLPRALLELAEAQSEAGSIEFRGAALEAAWHLRRGRTQVTAYLPDALLRCSNLLKRSDPDLARALREVARQWVLNALPHVPREAQDSFATSHAVNRLLLAD